jgi:hypothetical protein
VPDLSASANLVQRVAEWTSRGRLIIAYVDEIGCDIFTAMRTRLPAFANVVIDLTTRPDAKPTTAAHPEPSAASRPQ